MLGTVRPGQSGRLAVEVRVGTSGARGPHSWSRWSGRCEVDPLQGPASVLAPLEGEGASASCYALMLAAVPVPDGGGALVLHVLPRCVMHNALDIPLQVRCPTCAWLWWRPSCVARVWRRFARLAWALTGTYAPAGFKPCPCRRPVAPPRSHLPGCPCGSRRPGGCGPGGLVSTCLGASLSS